MQISSEGSLIGGSLVAHWCIAGASLVARYWWLSGASLAHLDFPQIQLNAEVHQIIEIDVENESVFGNGPTRLQNSPGLVPRAC